MNWSKIKSILIAVLIVTNIVLFLNLEAGMPTGSERKIEDVLRLYEIRGVKASYGDIDIPEQVNGRLAELTTITPDHEDEILRYFSPKNREYNLTTKDNTILCLWEEIPEGPFFPLSSPEDSADYLNRCRELFRSFSIDFVPAFLEFYSLGDIVVVQVYQEVKHGIPEIESSAFVYFYNKEIVGLRIDKCLRLSSELGGRYAIISLADALYEALQWTESGDTMKKIRIVYKLNDDSLLATNLVRGEMFPYYEFRFENAAPIYIRATQ